MTKHANATNSKSRVVSGAPAKHFRRQGGWTFWGLLIVIPLVMFFVYVGARLAVVYLGNENVKGAMTLSTQDVDLRRVTRAQIIQKMRTQLRLDGTRDVLNYKTDLQVQRKGNQFSMRTQYRREIPLFYNISLVVDFDNHEEVTMGER